MEDLKFEIVESIGSFSDPGDHWQKELNLIRWNDNAAKYDIRSWNKTHDRMSKGITLSLYEIRQLKELLNSIEI